MPRDLVLVGAGGLGRETASLVADCNAVEPAWNLLGFLDDSTDLPDSVGGVPVLGPVATLERLADAMVVLCTARPDNYWSRKRLFQQLGLPRERYATLVHPTAALGSSVRLGAGVIVLAGVVATADVVIGDHVAVMPGCVFTHDDVVKDHATLGAGVLLAGGVTVGEGAYVGTGALVREGSTIGPWSLIGMGAAVLGDVPAAQVWIGAPARALRSIDVPRDVID